MMNKRSIEEATPKFYGATTIGERGQVVIPAEARKDLEMVPSSKVLVFGSPTGEGLLIIKAESIAAILTHATKVLKGIEETLKSSSDDSA
jgi:AbrB family looped-hinge helix DNA binding protein